MKERLITLGLAACALALFWVLMFPKPQGAPLAPHPLTNGPQGEGYLAAWRWLAATHVPTAALHQRFDHLGDPARGSTVTGNLLIVTLPFAVAPHPEELEALQSWIARGNTLLVLAALDDTPMWSIQSDNLLPEVQKLTRLGFGIVRQPQTSLLAQAKAEVSAAVTAAGRTTELHTSGHIAFLDGISHLATLSALPSTQWQAKALDESPVLELARRADSSDSVLWLKPSGHGAMVISAYASLFNNDVIGKSDNARLLSNAIAWSLKPGGQVIFDDAHQGAIDEYDARRFFADPRLHHTLLWLLALWLAWVMGAQALRAVAPPAASLDENAMLGVTARFFASVLRPVSSAQWLLDEFFDRLRRRHGLAPSAAPPWDWLAAHAGVGRPALAELRTLYARTRAGRRVNLMRLQQLLSQISGHTS